jgi:hypothetical protein
MGTELKQLLSIGVVFVFDESKASIVGFLTLCLCDLSFGNAKNETCERSIWVMF